MAFCSNCGGKIEDGVKFCSGCGKPINSISNESAVLITDVGSGQPQVQMPMQNLNKKSKGSKALHNLSIIAIILLPLFCLSSVAIATDGADGVMISAILIISIFGYMIAHSIVAIIYGAKRKIMSLTIIGIIGILFYFISCAISVSFLDENELAFSLIGLIVGLEYGIIFAIFSMKKSEIKT